MGWQAELLGKKHTTEGWELKTGAKEAVHILGTHHQRGGRKQAASPPGKSDGVKGLQVDSASEK